MEDIVQNVQSGIADYVQLPNTELVLFAISVGAVLAGREWKALLFVFLGFAVGLIPAVIVSIGDVYSIAPKSSVIGAVCIVLLSAAFNLTSGGKFPKPKIRGVLALFLGAFYGLNEQLISKAFYEKVSIWSDSPLVVLKIIIGFFAAVVSVQIISWLILTAFTIVKRDWIQIVSGIVLGAAGLTIITILAA